MSLLYHFPPGARPGHRGAFVLTSALTGLLAVAGPGPALAAARPGAAPTQQTARQDVAVSGRVTGPDGAGIPGVTVLAKGTTNGTSTNADGQYVLNVPEGSTLVFSFVGYKTQEVAVGANKVIDVALAVDQQALNEVVVVGYGTQTRQELTTAVSSVNAAAIERQTVAGFDQALQGQTPGVQVSAPSGAPGAAISVQIRGLATIGLNASPLYVIDGVPILPTYDRELAIGNQRPNPLNAINPADIESIDVLKDGAAAAIYGVRASNGVVVITTKRGKAGTARVGFNAYFGQQKLRKKLDLLNASQFAEVYNDIQRRADPTVDLTDPTKGFANPAALGQGTDWQDAIYRTGNIQNYGLNVSGGTDKTRYYLSGGYFKQDGIIINSGLDRYTFKTNFDQQVGNHVRAGVNLNLSRTNNNGSVRSELGLQNSGTVLGALAAAPTVPIYNPDGTYGTNPLRALDNPVGNLNETHNRAILYQVIGNTYAELDFLKNFTLRTSVGIDYRTQLENENLSRELPGTTNSDPATRGSARTASTEQAIWLWENTLTYRPKISEDHDLTLLVGESSQESNRFTSNISVSGFPSNAGAYIGAGSQVNSRGSYEEAWGLQSYFARAIYNYKERYLATLSLRADQSSRFRAGKRTGYFPAVGLGWRVSKEGFFPQNGTVSEVKIRGSYGENGNQEIPVYGRFNTFNAGNNYQSGSAVVGGIGPGTIGNPDITWETTRQFNLGLDVGAFANRLTFTADLYRKRTSNLLFLLPLNFSTGAQPNGDFASVITNLGEIQNQGLELGLNTANVQAQNNGFGWNTNFNLTFNRNKVNNIGTLLTTDRGEQPRAIINDFSVVQAGAPLGAFYGWVTDGIFQTPAEVAAGPKQPNAAPGDIRFKDLNNDGVIDDKDRTVIGNPNPKAIAGVTNTFTFKGLELSVFFQGSFGNDIYNQNRMTTEGLYDPFNQTTRVLNRWMKAGDQTDIPRAVRNDPNRNDRMSNRFIEDGSYVRLKNLTLAYNFGTFVNAAGLSSLRLYVTGQNLITWTHYLGYDPEVSADPLSTTGFGRDYGVYPQARTYTVGLNANF